MRQKPQGKAQPTEDSDLQTRYETLQEVLERLQEADQRRQDQVNMIVHDLKAPLSIIVAGLDLLRAKRGSPLSAAQAEVVDVIQQSAEEMLHLITNLLEVQRLVAGQMPIDLQPVDVGWILRTTVNQARCLAEQNHVALHLHLPEPSPWAWADAHLTSRVVMNLVDNAIKNTPREGQVLVAGQATRRETVVSIADSGPGVPAAYRDRLFEKFSQMEHGAWNGEGSVGLGLAFCRMAVTAQRGWIEFESRPDRGALFRFGLPLWRTDNAEF
jgi:signal transduction histidine kinase